MTAVSGQRLANLTKEMLTKIPTSDHDQSFDHFYANASRKSGGLLGEPMLPRNRCTSARLEIGAGAPSYPKLPRINLEGFATRLLIFNRQCYRSAL